ncbi:flagellar hook-basal body complex protein [uncultured Oscillibacter sp.]|uniref:flagellar hook-basal body complex protein n=1 Tax=uncultured Oscillibacter sp. TaxID=876091 RepID=UPI0026028591|nr:flagellar hook-basal body complex protein [uncultured Oscillibacter sp.]
MTGSMYASVAGLRAHMQKLSVIGNNVANVNTQGYKKQRTMFRDSVYSLYSSGGNGTSTVGGINPSQIGYGSMVGSIDLNMSSASYNPGSPMDCALVGDGFFLVGDKTVADSIDGNNPASLKSLTLTRVGDFQFKADGYLCDGKGNVVYGFMTTGVDEEGKPIVSDQLVPIRKPHWERVPTKETVEDPDNPDKEITRDTYKYEIRYATDKTGPAADGGAATVGKLDDQKKPLHPSNWVNKSTGATMTEDQVKADPDAVADLDFAEFSNITINQDTGAIVGICREGDQQIVMGYLAIGSVTNPNGVTHSGESYYKCQDGAGDLRVCMLGGVQKDLGITNVNSYMVQAEADPDNPAAGNQKPLPPGTAILSTGGTEIMVGFLEAPNVDLAEEISELITTQRGYQANTRIITVTDSMLEELVNMKR